MPVAGYAYAFAHKLFRPYRNAGIKMPPKINNTVVWQQAELLMQPAFIRVIDHIGKQLEESDWKGTYQDVLIWPTDTTEETKAIVTQLLQQKESATAEDLADIEQTLSQLGQPYPGYYLCLQRQEQQVKVDLWELCYQVCFRHYSPLDNQFGGNVAEIDTSLIDETGDVDWSRLDAKAVAIVGQVFTNLPPLK